MKMREISMLRMLLRNQRRSGQSASFGQRIIELIRSDSSGSALVELAIALPVYLIVLTGTVSTVMALSAYQQLAFATFAASEAIGANRALQSDPCALAATTLVAGLPDWSSSNLTMDVYITEYVDGAVVTPPEHYGPFTPASTGSCSGDISTPGNGTYAYNVAQNQPVTVRVSYNYTWYPIYSNQITTGPMVAAETSIIR
ncbi:MAG: TadE family protein [Terracidiphilus sp.]|jgi:Flp pilus assembly protein TadG